MSFKHKYAVAEAFAWGTAIDKFVKDDELKSKIAFEAANYVDALSKGETVAGVNIDNLRPFADIFDKLENNANAAKQGFPNA